MYHLIVIGDHVMSIANKSKVLHGVPRDPIMATALTQLEEEEMDSLPDDERPKVTQFEGFSHSQSFP